ncbi:MAG: adenylate/guanylate cyclase domain-containing protein [Anaerolineae bacterium]|nr:adenylate/guanylate cyclase domain-containing protein [Anaerolineae bacterium]
MIRDRLRRIFSFFLSHVPAQYAESFFATIAAENFRRVIVGGAIVSLVELGVFFTTSRMYAGTFRYPLFLVFFNLLTLPLLVILDRRETATQHKRLVVHLVAAFYLYWACAYSGASQTDRPSASIPLYMLMVYGMAIFVYLEPLWSAGLFLSGMVLYIALLPFDSFSRRQLLGSIWNALALNIFAWLTSYLLFAFRRQTFVAQKELEEARAKSDALLLNILPAKIVTELKETGAVAPERFDRVTVFFSDLVDFTAISSHLAPEVLIGELDDLFTAFDEIVARFQCERIKTIGDAYLCVCGMPEPHPCHAEQILQAAFEIVAYLEQRNATHPHPWQIRIGVHSGSVVGGIVGRQKYIYDVFGDTINIANRMENHSASMQINVSETTYRLARKKFLFVARDPIEVKGLGEMRMYFCRRSDAP